MRHDNRNAIDFANEPVGKLFRQMLVPTLIGMVSIVILNLTDGAFVGHGAGADSLVGTVLNIFLDWLFIFPFGWGLEGAAKATSLSFGIAGLCNLHGGVAAFQHRHPLHHSQRGPGRIPAKCGAVGPCHGLHPAPRLHPGHPVLHFPSENLGGERHLAGHPRSGVSHTHSDPFHWIIPTEFLTLTL